MNPDRKKVDRLESMIFDKEQKLMAWLQSKENKMMTKRGGGATAQNKNKNATKINPKYPVQKQHVVRPIQVPVF